MNSILWDIRYALRQWLAQPGFAVSALLALTIGIAANVTLFSLVNALLLSPVRGISEPQELVEIGNTRDGAALDNMSYPNFRDLAAQSRSIKDAYAFTFQAFNLSADGEPVRSFGLLVSGNYFPALRTSAAAGRMLGPADVTTSGADAVAVVSYAGWQKYFRGDRAAIGRTVHLNGKPFTLVGVAAPEFRGHIALVAPEFYVPLTMRSALGGGPDLLDSRGSQWLLAGARLLPGATVANLRSELAVISQSLKTSYPDQNHRLQISAAPMRALPSEVVQPLGMFSVLLFVLVGLVLLLACVNVAGMLLARGEARRDEIAMRVALGASRARVLRQMLTEGALLALIAGTVGLAVALLINRILTHIDLPASIPVPLLIELPLDWRVAGFAVLLSLFTALTFALIPALRVSAQSPQSTATLRGTGIVGSRSRLREWLVSGQVGMTVILLVSAGLFVGSLVKARQLQLGFEPEQIQVADLDLSPGGYTPDAAAAAAERITERLRATPGIVDAVAMRIVPMSSDRMSMGAIMAKNLPDDGLSPDVNVVAPSYFSTFGIHLRGRGFAQSDSAKAEAVAVINQALAEQLFGDAEAIDQRFDYGNPEEKISIRVIGVAPNGKYASLSEDSRPFLYLPLAQSPMSQLNLAVKTTLSIAAAQSAIKAAVQGIDPLLPAPRVARMSDVIALSLLPQKIAGLVAVAVGIVGLLLAALGLHGLISQYVASRIREFGVKLALGASPHDIGREIWIRGGRLVSVGLVGGLLLSLVFAQLVSSLMFGLALRDGLVFVGAAALLMLVAVVACLAPARRAAAILPSAALRCS